WSMVPGARSPCWFLRLHAFYVTAQAATRAAWWTSTDTIIVAFPGLPITFPATGAASAGVRVAPTRIRSGDSTRPLVGSNSIQPRPGRKASHQAWVAPAPRRAALGE